MTTLPPPADAAAVSDPLGDDWLFSPLPVLGDEPAYLDDPDRGGDPSGPLWPSESDLDATRPGALLAAMLGSAGLGAQTAAAVVATAAAADRLASWAASMKLAATEELLGRCRGWRGVAEPGSSGVVDPDRVTPELMAATELAAGLGLSPQSARNLVELAKSLRRLPATRAALAAGRIDLAKARDVADILGVLGDQDARTVEARVLENAPGRTAAMLRRSLRRAVLSVDPVAAQVRHQDAVAQRGVHHETLDHGMGRLEYVDAIENVEAFYRWVTGKAVAARFPGDPRTLDQRRADVIADIGGHGLASENLPTHAGRRPQIGVVISWTTLLGLDDQPAELAGVGPITAQVARRIAADAVWRRLVTDPRTGVLTEMSTTRYEPSQTIRDAVIARDQVCRGPGCLLRAELCDLDHRIPHPRGPTEPANLDPGCRPWHRVKTHTDTIVEPDGHGGLRITLPSGRRYHRPAEPLLEQPDEKDIPPF